MTWFSQNGGNVPSIMMDQFLNKSKTKTLKIPFLETYPNALFQQFLNLYNIFPLAS